MIGGVERKAHQVFIQFRLQWPTINKPLNLTRMY